MRLITGCYAISLLVATSTMAATIKDAQRIKDPDGKTLAIVVVCSQCQKPKQAETGCRSGVAEGFWDGEPCGDCLINSNWGYMIRYPYDLAIMGHLKDAAGKPIVSQFVRLRMPNNWSVTTRTSEEGKFHLILGATQTAQSKQPVVTDVGSFVAEKTTGKDEAFMLYMLPVEFRPCTRGSK